MSTHKKIDSICITTILLVIMLTVLLMSGKFWGAAAIVSAQSDSGLFTANDLNADWDTSSATEIVLSDKGSVINGNGAYIDNGNVCIVYAGHYVLTGELTNGNVIIDADKEDKIWISLKNAAVHCEDDAAIRIEQADQVFLTLAKDTENTVSSGPQYNARVMSSGVDGAIYSRDDLTINGTGALVINTEYEHGIVCNDDLMITGGTISINAMQDGIHANDSVRIQNADISISAGDDGITVSNDDETAFLYVESGNIKIPSCYEGFEAANITITGGTIDIESTDDGFNADGSGSNSSIRITGGDITLTNPSGRDADGLDSNGSIYIEGGTVFISVSDSGGNYALDYGIENGGECIISGGTVVACGSSAMAEGFDNASIQGFLMYNAKAEAGTTICLKDSAGKELLSEDIPCAFSSVVLSTPELKTGDICTIMIGDMQEQITIDNTPSAGFDPPGMPGGVLPVNGRIESPGGMEIPEGIEAPDGMKAPEGVEPPDSTDSPDAERFQRRGTHSRQQDREQMHSEETAASSALLDGTWTLLGISILALLIGLLIAGKIKH